MKLSKLKLAKDGMGFDCIDLGVGMVRFTFENGEYIEASIIEDNIIEIRSNFNNVSNTKLSIVPRCANVFNVERIKK